MMSEQKSLYDLDAIRDIPILDVCHHLALDIEKRGRNFWCKVRPENTASVILHTDTNYFYDFGNRVHGNNIDLVLYAKGHNNVGKAIRELAQAFNIPANESREDHMTKPMSFWEYKKIGLYSDMATKNLIFPVTTASIQELLDMEHAYRMPMNQLRTAAPEVYQDILQQKAVPFVEHKRNCFYMSVWNHFHFLKTFHREVLFFDSEKTADKFEAEIRSLRQSERALYKACQGTDISVPEPKRYNPQRVLSHLLQGELDIPLGPMSTKVVIEEATRTGEAVHGSSISYEAYCMADTDGHTHAATFSAGRVFLDYPEREAAFFAPLIRRDHRQRSSLNFLVADAESRSLPATDNESKEPEPVR